MLVRAGTFSLSNPTSIYYYQHNGHQDSQLHPIHPVFSFSVRCVRGSEYAAPKTPDGEGRVRRLVHSVQRSVPRTQISLPNRQEGRDLEYSRIRRSRLRRRARSWRGAHQTIRRCPGERRGGKKDASKSPDSIWSIRQNGILRDS